MTATLSATRARGLAVVLFLAAAAGCQCGTSGSTIGNTGGGGGALDAGGGGGSGGGGGGGADAGQDAGASCRDGDACGDGGVCAGGTCCAGDLACGAQCCASGQVCSFLQCVAPGPACRDSSDCSGADFCDLSVSTPAVRDGGVCVVGPTPGRCLSPPPGCPPDAGAAAGRSCVEPCRFTRAAGQLDPVVKYAWGDWTAPGTPDDVMMAPIVAQLTDDDCDGRITSQDQPEIVFVTFASGAYTQVGTAHAVTVRGGQLVDVWAVPALIKASSQLASGNVDGQPGNEVVGCTPTGPVALNGADGSVLWQAPAGPSCTTLSLADLEGDGHVEVITESTIYAGETGAVLRTLPAAVNNTIADVDGDGQQDVVTAAKVYQADTSVLAEVSGPAGYVAIGDLDLDGRPEIVSVNSASHTLSLWSYDPAQPAKGRLVRTGVDINLTLSPSLCPAGSSGNTRGGGPPTVGDFNADGYPDVALAGGIGYAVFDGRKLMDAAVADADTALWIRQTRDCSSAATGSTLFDFDGDGQVEAVYGDELNLHIYDSATGAERFTTCNTSGTLIEYPLVADVDNDGQADLVVASNAYAFSCAQPAGERRSGIRVFSSASGNWVVTRRVWNQHAYSVTNIEEDGRVPAHPARNWTVPGLNNFRQNKQPGLEFAAADAVVSVAGACEPAGVVFDVVVRNIGEASMPAGVGVELVVDPTTAPMVLTTLATTRALGPTQAERLTFVAPVSVAAREVLARLLTSGLRQCRTDNDTSAPPVVGCLN